MYYVIRNDKLEGTCNMKEEIFKSDDCIFINTTYEEYCNFLKNNEGKNFEYNIVTKKIVAVKKIEGIKIEWNGTKYIETATLEEQRQHWLNSCLEVSKKIEEYRAIGLEGGQEYITLEKELETYKKNYINACQSEAIAIDKHMSSTKPVK